MGEPDDRDGAQLAGDEQIGAAGGEAFVDGERLTDGALNRVEAVIR